MKGYKPILAILLLAIVILFDTRVQLSVSAQSNVNGRTLGYLDSPTSGEILKGLQNITGWFLDEIGIASIEVLVDDKVVGQATYGDARPDVQNAFPELYNGNPGFHFALDTTRYDNGQHSITIREIATNGRITVLPAINVTFENENPIGYIDNPVDGATFTGTQKVSGWFLDRSGVEKIEVLVDGKVVGQAVYGDERPDVRSSYPDFNNLKSGYHYMLDTTQFSDGQHTISIRETGKNGQVTTLPEHKLSIANLRGYLDNPFSGESLAGIKRVSGWFLDANGVESIEVLVDGKVVGQAVYGNERPDVINSYPDFNNLQSGFHYMLDTTQFTDGQYIITIREIGKNGRIATLPEQEVTITNVRGYLDNPISGATLTGEKRISGWFLDGHGVEKIEVLVDGKVVGQAVYGDERPDVKNSYPDFNNGHSGYHYMLDTTQFSDGQHSISIRETGENGQVTTLPEQKVTIENIRGYLDNPISGATLTGTKRISGWFLDAKGVKKIEVLVDGKVVGQAVYGDERPDVKNSYPDFNNEHSGYHFMLDTTQFSDGQHTISIRETGEKGQVTTLPEQKVTIVNIKGYLDNPISGATLTGTKRISGWFLDANGVEKIEVLVDGKVVGQAVYGDERPDVKNSYSDFNNGHSGYHYMLDTTQFSDGQHTLAIRETGENGQVTVLPEQTVTFANSKGYIDNLFTGENLEGNKRISGWFLDVKGIDRVEILVDGKVVGHASYGEERLDVLYAFPDFNNRTSGYHYTLDTTLFSNGHHTITVRGINKTGRVTTLPGINVIIKQSRTVFLDPGHGGYDPGAISANVREAELNLAVAKKVESLLVNRGYNVIMSRTNNTYVGLLDRSIMANSLAPDIFVSIHHNNAGSTNANGIETYYYEYDSNYPPKINQNLHNNIERIEKSVALSNLIQHYLIGYTGANNRGTDGGAYSVVREAAMPATLLELGFISNTQERQKLTTDNYQNTLAKAIADGIDEYFKIYR
ncbi:N-acetylmuramoyl-L-alanine amidase [Bacillus sp. 1P02SD]|uniref:N-acetylmuramoyl-L-alanine amidase n=1 Tax=Bacillus sp. 1P02SD TaxID=3132264 RepID=UPI0039A34739